MCVCVYIYIYIFMFIYIDRRTDGWMDGWMDEWIDRKVDMLLCHTSDDFSRKSRLSSITGGIYVGAENWSEHEPRDQGRPSHLVDVLGRFTWCTLSDNIYIYMYVCIFTYVYIHIHNDICIYIYIHIYIIQLSTKICTCI